jgi:hypothetical protein
MYFRSFDSNIGSPYIDGLKMTDSHIYCFLVFRAGGCPFYSLSRSHPSEIYVLQISDLPLPCFSCPSFSWSEILGRLSFQKIWNFRPDYPDSLDADTPFSFSENLGVKNTRALQGPLRESHAIHCIFPPFFPKKWPSLDRKNGVQLCWITQFIASIFRHIPNQSIFFWIWIWWVLSYIVSHVSPL